MRPLLGACRDAPPHMQLFYNLLKSSHDANAASLADNLRVMAGSTRTLCSLATRVDELVARVDVVVQTQDALSGRLDADLTAVREDITRITATNRDSINQHSLQELREIIVRWIPLAVQLEPLHLAAALLTAINLPHHAPLVYGWRAWSPPARPDLPAPVAAAAPAAPQLAAQLRAIVFTLASPEARDDILRRTPGLKILTCLVIFGTGGVAKLSVNALWPDSVHRLVKHATAKYKQLGHLRSLVKNLMVFLRPIKNGPLLPIPCEADIDVLTPQLP